MFVHAPFTFELFDASYHQLSDDPNCDGAQSGIALTEVDAGPTPRAFVAVTEKEYVVPFVNPLTTQVVAGAVAVQVAPPGDAVTV